MKSEVDLAKIKSDHLIDFVMADQNNKLERKDVKKSLMASGKIEHIIGIICKHELFNDLLKGNP